MSLYAFKLLSPVVQLHWVIKHGTFLAQRWDDESGVNLYHCAGDGFFVEVGVENKRGQLRIVYMEYIC